MVERLREALRTVPLREWLALMDEAAAEIERLRSVPASLDRESLARVIDPDAFDLSSGAKEGPGWWEVRREFALKKVDAILAQIAPVIQRLESERDAWKGRAQALHDERRQILYDAGADDFELIKRSEAAESELSTLRSWAEDARTALESIAKSCATRILASYPAPQDGTVLCSPVAAERNRLRSAIDKAREALDGVLFDTSRTPIITTRSGDMVLIMEAYAILDAAVADTERKGDDVQP